MEGYLYVEQDPGDTNSSPFTLRYFVSFPFCGLRWFDSKPNEKDIYQLLSDREEEKGWVYGGSIKVNQVKNEEILTFKNNDVSGVEFTIYPFSLSILTDAMGEISILLAADDKQTRELWIEEISRAINVQHYIYACQECEAPISRTICFAIDNENPSELILDHVELTVPVLGSMIMHCRLSDHKGAALKILSLSNAQLGDKHMPLVSSLLSFTPCLTSISLVDNNITCVGLKTLAEGFPCCQGTYFR
jgi:hypothetical protein